MPNLVMVFWIWHQKWRQQNKDKWDKNYQVCKKKGNMTYGEEKNQAVEINTEMTQMIKLIDKYIKTSIINVSYIFK